MAPALWLLVLGALLALTLWLERRHRRDPRRIGDARLAAMLDRTIGHEERAAGQRLNVFLARRTGLRGAWENWLDRQGAGVGGRAGLRALSLIALAAAAGAAFGFAQVFKLGVGVAAVAGLGVGAGAFMVIASERRRRFVLAFQDQLIEAVELLSRCVRTGYAAPAAVRLVAKEMGEPVGPIFLRIADQEDIGVEPRKALRDAARSVQLPDFTFLAIALVIQRETGGRISETLENLHFVLRRRKEARLKTQALTAQGRMSANVVAAIPFVAFFGVSLMNPDQARLLTDTPLGRLLLAVALGFVVVGVFVVRLMVRARA